MGYIFTFLKKTGLISFLLSLQILATGQVLDMEFTYPVTDKKFNGSDATSIVQDSLGFLWIGTKSGLFCYNGRKINQYVNQLSDTTSLVDNNINKVFMDASGTLWVATNLGLCIYDKYYDNFIWKASERNFAGLEEIHITDIKQNRKGQIFVAVGNSVYIYKSGRFELFFKIETGLVNVFIFDKDDNMWIGASGDGGLTYYNIDKNETKNFRHENNDNNSLSNSTIRDISLQDNKLWIATYGGGMNMLNLTTLIFKRYPPPDEYAGYVTYTYLDNDNNIWICDLTGIKLYNKESDYFHGYYAIEQNPTSIKSSAVAIFQGKQGNYWSIHSPGGLGKCSVQKGFVKYQKDPTKFWHTSDNNTTAIEFDSYGNWWLGNGFNGIDVFDWGKGEVRSYHSESNDPYSLGKGGIACIYRDRNQTMWIGSNFGGLQYYDEIEDRFYSYMHDPLDTNSIANNDIRSITEDNDGNLWLITHGNGVDKFSKSEKKFYHYSYAKNSLSNDWAFQVLFDSNENIWVATAWGVSKLEKGSETFQNYYHTADTNTINNNVVNCIFEDSDKQIWVGTEEGICRYNYEHDNFTRFNPGLASNNIGAIEEDSNKILWISTREGISSFNPATGKIFNFETCDGLLEGTFLKRAVNRSEENQIFFGGIGGLIAFNPNQLKYNVVKPEVVLTEFQLFYEPIKSYGEESVLKKHVNYTDEIILKHNQTNIGFEFVATNLINPEQNRFKYILEGADKYWITSNTENKVTYSHIPPGKYTFKVIASNNDGVWAETEKSIKIKVLPPWWLSWWFKSLVILFAISVVLIVYYLRTASLIKQKKNLEHLVWERTNDLNEKNKLLKDKTKKLIETNLLLEKRQYIIETQKEDLRLQAEKLKEIAKNLEITNVELSQINATKDKLFSIIAHDLINPFNVILGFTNELIINFRNWTDNEKLTVLGYVLQSSDNTFKLLENLLQWSRSQKGSLEFKPVLVNVSEITNEVLNDVMHFAMKKEVEIIDRCSDTSLQVFADSQMLKIICRNLLMNAVKFSHHGGKTFIEVEDYNASFVRFSIIDQGVGMERDKAESLFDLQSTKSTEGTDGEKGVGLGLLLCKDFVALHKGNIWVESKLGEGSTFFFTIPRSAL